jgi:hypothetical protein
LLCAWSFAASTILPLSSELALVLVITRSGGWVVPVAVATVGKQHMARLRCSHNGCLSVALAVEGL